jgi:hypothetical protein
MTPIGSGAAASLDEDEAGAPDNPFDITPQMVSAGVSRLRELRQADAPLVCVVSEVYEATERARPDDKGRAPSPAPFDPAKQEN